MRHIVLPILLLGLVGCASRSSLPASASEVDFNGAIGKTGWAEYHRNEFYPGATAAKVRMLAVQALNQGGFAVFRDDPEAGCVQGEHGATRFDWNVMAGVYYKQEPAGVRIRYVIEASKDIGIMGDKTDRDWISEINGRIRIGLGQ